MLIIKAGGSAITYKDRPFTLNEPVMTSVAHQLGEIEERAILIHGVGSYGHPPAKKYRIGRGDDGTHARLMGLMLTHYWVDELSQRFTKILIDHDLPALRCRPTTFFVTEGGRIVDFYAEPLARFLAMGMLPVLHGDGPADRAQGFAILSGDQIATYLARHFGARKVIFGMDVPGLLRDGEVIPELGFADLPEVKRLALDNRDASGGLRRKLDEIGTLAGAGIPVQLVGFTSPGTLLAAAHDQRVGTLII